MVDPVAQFESHRERPKLLVVSDHEHACVYLPHQTARMPLQYPDRRLDPSHLDDLLEQGHRRSGKYIYRTHCPKCQACEPTRIRTDAFRLSNSFRRVMRRGARSLEMRVGTPTTDADRIAIFNTHRLGRSLAVSDEPYSANEHESFLVDTCCETIEFSFWKQNRLVACAIADIGRVSISAVYTYFDPQYAKLSLGTYAILKEWEWAVAHHKQFLYLGMYVAANSHLNYKARFQPQERRIDGRWQPMESEE